MNKVGEIKGIPLYHDKYIDDKTVLIGYKTNELINPKPIFLPTENLKNFKNTTIEKEEVDRILKMKKNRNFEDLNFVICSYKDENTLIKIENLLKKINIIKNEKE
jgi:tRNA A37 threonylcarbamoyladenosine synthetase subunit TsaC/SUA5/YrdC